MNIIQNIEFTGQFEEGITPDVVKGVCEMLGYAVTATTERFSDRNNVQIVIKGVVILDHGANLDLECDDFEISNEFIYQCGKYQIGKPVIILPSESIEMVHVGA